MMSEFKQKMKKMARLGMAFALMMPSAIPVKAAVGTVTVNLANGDGDPVDGIVYAVKFGTNGPDGANSTLTTTTGGTVDLNLEFANGPYEIFASVPDLGPTPRNQMFDPAHPRVSQAGTVNIILDEDLSGRGQIDVVVTNATANRMVFANVRKISTGRDIQMGGCVANGAGTCTVSLDNIPAGASGVYDVFVFDPSHNSGEGRGNGGPMNLAVVAGNVTNHAINLNGGLPPKIETTKGNSSLDQQVRQSQEVGGGKVSGIVVNGADNSQTIPWGWVELKVFNNGQYYPRGGSGIDQNGRFEFFGLENGTTYYVQTMGGCRQGGQCFTGIQPAQDGTPSSNDFVYDSSQNPYIHMVELAAAPAGTASLTVRVKDQEGNLIPQAWVSLWPDGRAWHSNPAVNMCDGNPWHGGVEISNPGFAQRNSQASDGTVTFSDLREGNYSLSVNSPFGQTRVEFNAGPDGETSWGGGATHYGCSAETDDDLRLTIENDDSINVYDVEGNIVQANPATIDLVLDVSDPNATAQVSGTLEFSESVDLSVNPVLIVVRYCDQNGCTGGYDAPTGSGTSFNYSINVDPTKQYWMEVKSGYFGLIRTGGGEDRITFPDGVTTITKNLSFAKAGCVEGYVRKPDGSVFIPGQTENGWINGNVNTWSQTSGGWSELDSQGRYKICGLLPGKYPLHPTIWGGGDVSWAAPRPPTTVTVTADKTTDADVRFVNGEVVSVGVPTDDLPELDNAPANWGGYRGEQYVVRMFPAGWKFDAKHLTQMMFDHDGEQSYIFRYQAAGNGNCGPGWPGGYCPDRLPSPTALDAYLIRSSDLEDKDDIGTNEDTYMYATFLKSLKGVAINSGQRSAPQVPFQGSNVTPIHVDFTSTGITGEGGRVQGTVSAANIFREDQFSNLGGDEEKFFEYLPIVSFFQDGELKAAGVVTPDPSLVGENSPNSDQIDAAIFTSNWSIFSSLTQGWEWKYQVRGLPPGTYKLVATTPNYPTFTTEVTVAEGQVTTQNIDFDEDVVAGGTLSGTITDGTDPVSNATVKLESRAIVERIVLTGEDGTYSFEGLPAGRYKVTVIPADTYAADAAATRVTPGTTSTLNFALEEGPSEISGTVTELINGAYGLLKVPAEGVDILAYDTSRQAQDPADPVALIKTTTADDGTYSLRGLIPDHFYRIVFRAVGRYVQVLNSVEAEVAPVTGQDVVLTQKGTQLDVSFYQEGDNFTIALSNTKDFESGEVWYYPKTGGFNIGTATDITDDFEELPNGDIVATVPLNDLQADTLYELRIEAVPASGGANVVKTIDFSRDLLNSVRKDIDEIILGLDEEGDTGDRQNMVTVPGDNSGITFDAGSAILANDGVIPTAEVIKQEQGDGNLPDDVTSGGSQYMIEFGDVNFVSGAPVELCLSYDPEAVDPADIDNLALYTGDGTVLEPEQGFTVDQVQHLVCAYVEIEPFLSTQLNLNTPVGAQVSHQQGTMAALNDGRRILPNPRALASGATTLQVGIAASAGGVNASGYRQYNFPNPFNLKAKTVSLRQGTSGVSPNITGTYLVIAPTGSGLVNGKVQIFNTAGDLVREINESLTSGQYNYIHWDGRNTAGDDVASGVYFAVVDAPGAPDKKPIKLVVVK